MTRDHQMRLETTMKDDEEARKEELRRFVREKWRRIRELERQGSPSNLSISSEQELGPSKVKRDSRYKSAAVEYDPENPFDEKRGTAKTKTNMNRENRRVLKRSEQETTYKEVGEPSNHKAILTNNRPPLHSIPRQKDMNSVIQSQGNKAAAAKQQRGSINARGGLNVDACRGINKPEIEKMTAAALKKQGSFATSNTSRKSMSANCDDSALQHGVADMIDEVNKMTISNITAPASQSQSKESLISSKEDDTPMRRRKRRSEVAHYQPSASPLTLSAETSTALAELEANLARLKAHSSRSSLSREGKRRTSDVKEIAKDGSRRISGSTRRSLSPSKELRRLELMQSEEERGPKVSFLTRVRQAKEEAEIKGSAGRSTSATSRSQQMQSEIDLQKVNRRPRSSYTPTQTDMLHEMGVDSSCSIVDGTDNVDEILLRQQRQHQEKANLFLKRVRVLVDVRDQDGENASADLVESLRSVGAKVYTNIPSSISNFDKDGRASSKPSKKLTHIVYKNGRPATTQYLRSLSSAYVDAPIVVSVNWISQCLQQGKKVDETDFLVEIGKQAIFNKRRISMTPTQASAGSDIKGSHQQSLMELLAKKKTIQRAPAQPSPLARRCWNPNASTSSSISTATN